MSSNAGAQKETLMNLHLDPFLVEKMKVSLERYGHVCLQKREFTESELAEVGFNKSNDLDIRCDALCLLCCGSGNLARKAGRKLLKLLAPRIAQLGKKIDKHCEETRKLSQKLTAGNM